ncbi:MAG: amidohydrolase [Cyclobacteriaceae bacterium]
MIAGKEFNVTRILFPASTLPNIMDLKLQCIPPTILKVRENKYKQTILVVCCILMVGLSCSTQKDKADTVLLNGKIITVDENFSLAEAVAIKGGKILQVGENTSIRDLAGDDTRIIDLEGRTVIPGLIENHAHPVPASQSEFFDTIADVHTIQELLKWIADQADKKADNEWIIHPKFFITRLHDMRQITLKELDGVSPNNPVFLDGSYGGVVNSKALDLSGIRDLKHPGIFRDKTTGQPTGLIRSSVFKLLRIPKPDSLTASQKTDALKNLFRIYNTVGITSICSGGGPPEELKAFEELMQKNELTVRVFHNIEVPFDLKKSQEDLQVDVRNLGYKTGDGDEWVKVGALKVILDGGMLTGTAFLNEPWGQNAKDIYGITNPGYRGELFLTKNELIRIITIANDAGWKFTAHVTGGGGVDTLLAAYEAVNTSTPINQKRFSVIHGNFYSPASIKKMATLGVYADMQPAWFYKDTDLLNQVLGSERIKAFHPYNSLMEAGVVVNGGSDHMVKLDPDISINPYNPFFAMWSVITRKTDRGTVFNPEEAITREEALKMYTINNAYGSFEEKVKGSIESGKLADLVVLSHDILICPEDSIREIKSLLTMVGGKVVYESKKLKAESK